MDAPTYIRKWIQQFKDLDLIADGYRIIYKEWPKAIVSSLKKNCLNSFFKPATDKTSTEQGYTGLYKACGWPNNFRPDEFLVKKQELNRRNREDTDRGIDLPYEHYFPEDSTTQ